MNILKGLLFLASVLLLLVLSAPADAHRSGCHRWHSCPSDTGKYVCGDVGYCSQCPDNEYCKDGKPRIKKQDTSSEKESTAKEKPE